MNETRMEPLKLQPEPKASTSLCSGTNPSGLIGLVFHCVFPVVTRSHRGQAGLPLRRKPQTLEFGDSRR